MASTDVNQDFGMVCRIFDTYKGSDKFFMTISRLKEEMTPEERKALVDYEWKPTDISGYHFVPAFIETLKDCVTKPTIVETIFTEKGIEDSGLLKQVIDRCLNRAEFNSDPNLENPPKSLVYAWISGSMRARAEDEKDKQCGLVAFCSWLITLILNTAKGEGVKVTSEEMVVLVQKESRSFLKDVLAKKKDEVKKLMKCTLTGIPTDVWALDTNGSVPSSSKKPEPTAGTSQQRHKPSTAVTVEEGRERTSSTSGSSKRKRESFESTCFDSDSVVSEQGARKKPRVSSSSVQGSVTYEVDENGELYPIIELKVGQFSYLPNAQAILAREDIEKVQQKKLLKKIVEDCSLDLAKQKSKVEAMQKEYEECLKLCEELCTKLKKERTKKETCDQTVKTFKKIGLSEVTPVDVVHFFKSCNEFLESVHVVPGSRPVIKPKCAGPREQPTPAQPTPSTSSAVFITSGDRDPSGISQDVTMEDTTIVSDQATNGELGDLTGDADKVAMNVDGAKTSSVQENISEADKSSTSTTGTDSSKQAQGDSAGNFQDMDAEGKGANSAKDIIPDAEKSGPGADTSKPGDSAGNVQALDAEGKGANPAKDIIPEADKSAPSTSGTDSSKLDEMTDPAQKPAPAASADGDTTGSVTEDPPQTTSATSEWDSSTLGGSTGDDKVSGGNEAESDSQNAAPPSTTLESEDLQKTAASTDTIVP